MRCCKLVANILPAINTERNTTHVAKIFQIALKSTMSQTYNLIKPPECVRGMTTLDRHKFDTSITVPILNIKDAKISSVMPHLKKYTFKMPHLKPLQRLLNGTSMSALLNPEIVHSWSDINVEDREALTNLSISEADLSSTNLTIKYENFSADDIFKAVLPSDQEGFSSFSQIGHIVHINLRDHLFSYKSLISKVLLDKIANTRTVVNKTQNIDSTYRNFQMEVLCGRDEMMVKIKENRCEFEFDFSKVYWNPRLATEHERVVKMLSPGDVLFDIFAGVGPFSIPAAKKKSIVFANDLNPESYKWLNHNLKRNKIESQYLSTYNKDGHDFIATVLKDNLIKYLNTHNIHIVMNLPALAVAFLSGFRQLYKPNEIGEVVKAPIVHVYCFAKGENYVEIAKDLVFDNIGDISDKIINIFKVRTVSSLKEMMRVSFKLDRDILVEPNVAKRKHASCSPDIAISPKKCCHGEEQGETDEKRDESGWREKHKDEIQSKAS